MLSFSLSDVILPFSSLVKIPSSTLTKDSPSSGINLNNFLCSTLYSWNLAPDSGELLLSASTFNPSNTYPFLTVTGRVSIPFILATLSTFSPGFTFSKLTFIFICNASSLLATGISLVLTILTVCVFSSYLTSTKSGASYPL